MNYHDGVIKNTEFFTTAELAEKLKMNVQVITRKVQAGEIRAYKIGKEWRIPEQSVFDWLEAQANSKNTKAQSIPSPLNGDTKNGSITFITPSPRQHLLEYILAQFEPNRVYSEDEVNRLIGRHEEDIAGVRREFVQEKMLESTGKTYRRNSSYTIG